MRVSSKTTFGILKVLGPRDAFSRAISVQPRVQQENIYIAELIPSLGSVTSCGKASRSKTGRQCGATESLASMETVVALSCDGDDESFAPPQVLGLQYGHTNPRPRALALAFSRSGTFFLCLNSLVI